MKVKVKVKAKSHYTLAESMRLLDSEARNPGTLTEKARVEIRLNAARVLEAMEETIAMWSNIYDHTDPNGGIDQLARSAKARKA